MRHVPGVSLPSCARLACLTRPGPVSGPIGGKTPDLLQLRRRQFQGLGLAAVILPCSGGWLYMAEGDDGAIQAMRAALSDSPLEMAIRLQVQTGFPPGCRLPARVVADPCLTVAERDWFDQHAFGATLDMGRCFAMAAWIAGRTREGQLMGPAQVGAWATPYPEASDEERPTPPAPGTLQ